MMKDCLLQLLKKMGYDKVKGFTYWNEDHYLPGKADAGGYRFFCLQ